VQPGNSWTADITEKLAKSTPAECRCVFIIDYTCGCLRLVSDLRFTPMTTADQLYRRQAHCLRIGHDDNKRNKTAVRDLRSDQKTSTMESIGNDCPRPLAFACCNIATKDEPAGIFMMRFGKSCFFLN
jgi:hypothetical protein